MNLHRGYLGDHKPLCADLPPKHFLKLGAKWRYLGHVPVAELSDDPSSFGTAAAKHLALDASSFLYQKLCATQGGKCTFPSELTLNSNLECTKAECNIDTVRIVKLQDGDEVVWYEYVPVPCVAFGIYPNGKTVSTSGSRWPTQIGAKAMCADPVADAAGVVCCDTANNVVSEQCNYIGERVPFAEAEARCA
eukprot:5024086-Pleurochrysis_carterae.AAC.1